MKPEKTPRRVFLLAMLLMAPLLLMGQQNQATPAQPEEPPAEQAEESTGANTPAGPSAGNPPTAASESQPAAANTTPIKDFKPTDQIGADSAVAFPIDI